MNIYESLIGNPPTNEADLRAIAARLRGQDDRAILALLSGDRVLAPVGEMQMNQTQKQAGGLRKARDAMLQRENEKRMLAERLAAEQSMHSATEARLAASAEAQRKLMGQAYLMQHEATMAGVEENKRYHDLMADKAELQFQKEQRKLAAKEKEKLDMGTRQLAFKLQDEGITDLETALEMADKEAGKYFDPETGERVEGVTDIPGYGALTNPVGMVGLTAEGKTLRTAMAKVRNLILKARSGAAVTDPEMMRLAEELGQALGGTEDQVIQAYVALRKATRHVKAGIEAGFDPAVVEEYGRRFSARQRYPGAGANLPPVIGEQPSALPKTRRGTAVEIIE